MFRTHFLCIAIVVTSALATGCASYTTPGRAASFRAMGITADEAASLTEPSITERLERNPLASFPTSIAVVRVQGRGYYSHTARGYGSGDFTIVTTRDVERDDDFKAFADLPMIRGVVPLNRLVIPDRVTSDLQLRRGAAEVQADMLLIYTFDTVFGSESKMAPLAVFTIGMFPEREARVTSTVSAALLDTRNGFVYGLAEATSQTTQLANAWTSETAIDESRRRAEREAFEKLVAELVKMWQSVATTYGPDTET
jgi:hypothetical protein